jgi:hypothetical protein
MVFTSPLKSSVLLLISDDFQILNETHESRYLNQMITTPTFLQALESVGRRPNQGQSDAISAAKDAPLFVVAGPGTGKTACLTMRMLKLIYVDGVAPRGILATTFTQGPAALAGLARFFGPHEFLPTENGRLLNSQGLGIGRSRNFFGALFNPR